MYGDQVNAKMRAEKEAYLNQVNQAATVGRVGIGRDLEEPCRASLRERVESQLHRASLEARKLERLHELAMLLEKNPDVARILDLVEEVRG